MEPPVAPQTPHRYQILTEKGPVQFTPRDVKAIVDDTRVAGDNGSEIHRKIF